MSLYLVCLIDLNFYQFLMLLYEYGLRNTKKRNSQSPKRKQKGKVGNKKGDTGRGNTRVFVGIYVAEVDNVIRDDSGRNDAKKSDAIEDYARGIILQKIIL